MSVSLKTRAVVLDRDEYRCCACGKYVGPFGEYSIHHRRPRAMGGSKRPETDLPGNLIVLCGSGVTGCHGEVERHRVRALADGLLVSQAVNDPSLIPVRTWRGEALLDNDGLLVLVANSEGTS